jgi:hypothetical protein
MSSSTQEFATTLLRCVALQLPTDFTGVGVVFYENLDALPFLGLEVFPAQQFRLPVNGLESIASTLACASSAKSGWHDGFHFVDVSGQQLTHLAQFISPPLPPTNESVPKASGARHMTAMLATKVEGIVGIGVLTHGHELAYFERGVQTLRVTVQ